MVIEGFFIEMSAQDIIAHLHARSKVHGEAAEDVAKRIRDRLEDKSSRDHGAVEDDPDLDEVRNERHRAQELRFLAEHIPPETTYRLDPRDLKFLELLETTDYLPRRRRFFR